MDKFILFKLLRYAVLLLALTTVAACKTAVPITPIVTGNACENLGGDGGDPLYLRVYCVSEFDLAEVELAKSVTEFAAQQFYWFFESEPGTVYSSFSFRSVRAEFAHSVGLSGAGETIAIIDNGFYLDHPELINKNVTVFGSVLPEEDHGTAVAAIAAGSRDDNGIMGIAYNADLFVSSFDTSVGGLADATNAARLAGAIVQNNSWDIRDSAISNVINRAPDVTAYQAFAMEIGASVAAGTEYVDALVDFTSDGVVVFANSNDYAATELSLMAGLPLAFPELEAGWITALNGLPTFDGSGNISSATRISASCFEMAQSCLMAEGIVESAVGVDAYGLWVGTSFADPIISGGVAILAEAFPTLSGPEIRDRLLVTADNSFFAYDGVRDFQGGISHGYSADYGHGFMNLEAALLPIGVIGIPTGTAVSQGITPLAQSIVVTGSAQGDALIEGLANSNVMMLDSLGGNFRTNASSLVATAESPDGVTLFLESDSSVTPLAGALKTASAILNVRSPLTFSGGESAEVIADLGLGISNTGLIFDPVTMAALRPDNAAIGVLAPIAQGLNVSAHAFSSLSGGIGQTVGIGMAVQVETNLDTFSIGLSYMEEKGAALGMQSPINAKNTVGISHAIDVGYTHDLLENTRLSASGQIGLHDSSASGIWGGQTDTLFSSVGLNLNQANVFAAKDSISVSLRQPVAIENGSMSVLLPQTRDAGGAISSNSVSVNLAPSARQLDIGLEYEVPFGPLSDLTLGTAYSMNAGNISGINSFGVAAKYSMEF